MNYAQKVAANKAFGALIPSRYRILRVDRASVPVRVGDIVYDGDDAFGCRSDDAARYGVEFVACSKSETRMPFFTIPRDDIERL